MKLSFFITTTLALSITLSARSQKSVTVSLQKESLKQALAAIEQNSDYRFLYMDNPVFEKNKISINCSNASIDLVMQKILTGTGLTYSVNKKDLVIISDAANASQLQTISGIVHNTKGEPLANVSITVKGGSRGTTTNAKGEFSIEADNADVLVFSFVGYGVQEIKVGSQQNFDVALSEGENALNDVVIVGYGTQKKINLSGSVATVSGKTLTQSPAPTFTNLLQGQVAGLTVVQPTGEPGLDAGSIQIRGLGSYGSSTTPLILVDGIVSTISNLSPQDVESVSVLKDAASASIYGSRGANGVILITTKKGKKGTARIDVDNSFGTTSATILPKFITNSAMYMQLFNEALARNNEPALYTQAQIDAYKNGNGSAQYPNFDWMNYIFHNGPISSHTLSLSGGNDISNYYVSAGYQKQKGITDVYDYDRYNSVIDYNTRIIKRVKVGTNINMSYQNITSPNFTNDNLILLAYAQAPTFSPYLADGSGRRANRDYVTNGVVNRTVDEVFNEGAQYTSNYNINAQAYVDVDVVKGLDWQTRGAFVFFNQDYKNRSFPTAEPSYAFQPDANGNYITTGNGNPPFSGLTQYSGRNLTLTLNSTLNYVRDFGTDHHFTALFGYEQINDKSTFLQGQRFNFASSTVNELNGGPTTGWTNAGDATEYALQSLFGRVNYNYKGKYIVEGDMRYDGTSRVDSKYRWGTFGGGSAAWRISEENFIKDNISWLTDFKLRASYGVLGNQDIYINGSPAYYPYQAVLNNTQYPFGTSLSSGAILTALTSTNLRWEKTATTDFGADINIKQGLLGVTFDWYNKNTTGILAQQSDLPASVGLSAPVINAGAMTNKGVELAVSHQNHIGQFTYGANFLIAFNHNKVTQVLGPNKGIFQVGLPYNSFYLYQWDGIFQSQEEIDKSPAQPNSGTLKPGDLKIKDVDGNDSITPNDRISISPYPNYTYSFGINAGWKGFNLSAFFQGVQGQKFYVRDWGIDPFQQGTPPTTDFLNAWTEDNHSATVPAIYKDGYAGVDGYNSTYFLKNASYLRLKSVNLSYTFSQKLLRAPWLKDLTIYVSGSNLITWSKYPGADPERASSGRYAQFPQLKIYSGGIKISL